MSSVAESVEAANQAMRQIDALTEAINLLYMANGRNNCEWAEQKLCRAVRHIRSQQSALCEFHFPTSDALDVAAAQ